MPLAQIDHVLALWGRGHDEDALIRRAQDRDGEDQSTPTASWLNEPTAREVASAYLHGRSGWAPGPTHLTAARPSCVRWRPAPRTSLP